MLKVVKMALIILFIVLTFNFRLSLLIPKLEIVKF